MTDLTMSQFASKDDLLAAQAARIAELEAELEAVGAGGVQRLAAAPQAVQTTVPVAGQSRFKGEKDWHWCSPEHVAMVLATPSEWQGYEARYLYAHPAEGVPAQASEWDGRLPERLQSVLNALRLELPAAVVNDVEFEVRSHYEAMHTSISTLRRMYGAARDRLEAIDAAQPDPFAATQPAAQGMEADLTDEQIDEAFNQMPDGAAGFLKSWGYRQFARAVLAAQAKQGGA